MPVLRAYFTGTGLYRCYLELKRMGSVSESRVVQE